MAQLQPPVREIDYDDFHLACEKIEITGRPVPPNAPEVENTVWEFQKQHSTRNSDFDLVKRQCFNKCNVVGNKRREILPLLSPTKLKLKKKNQRKVKRLQSDLDGLMDQLRAKIADFNQFVPNGFAMPRHFRSPPALKEN